MATNLDELLTAIEDLRGDRVAALAVLMSAAHACMKVLVDGAKPGLRDLLEESDEAGFRVLVWRSRRVDLLVDDRTILVAEVPTDVSAPGTETRQ